MGRRGERIHPSVRSILYCAVLEWDVPQRPAWAICDDPAGRSKLHCSRTGVSGYRRAPRASSRQDFVLPTHPADILLEASVSYRILTASSIMNDSFCSDSSRVEPIVQPLPGELGELVFGNPRLQSCATTRAPPGPTANADFQLSCRTLRTQIPAVAPQLLTLAIGQATDPKYRSVMGTTPPLCSTLVTESSPRFRVHQQHSSLAFVLSAKELTCPRFR